MSAVPTQWQLLRTKTDETVDDPDWAGLNDQPTEPVGDADITVPCPPEVGHRGLPLAGVEVVVLATTAARVPADRVAGTVDLQIVEVVRRTLLRQGGSAGDAILVTDSLPVALVPLNRPCFFEMNGAEQWTIRITNDAALPAGTTQLQVWWRAVYR